MPDLSALASQREEIAIKDTQHSALSEQLTALRKREKKVAEKFEQAKSLLESVKDHIGKLRQEQESLFEKRERKQSSRHQKRI